jgi:hypothetical protein
MSFVIRNKTAGAIALNDLGLTVPASGDFDLTPEDPRQVATSTDLVTQIQSGNIVVLDPLDGVTELNSTISQDIVEVHNDPHYRIRGGTLNQLEDVNITGSPIDLTDMVLQWNGVDAFEPATPDDLVGGASNTVNSQIEALLTNGVNTTVVATGSPITALQVDVDDVFLKNTGDVLDSGTLSIASGAAIDVASGGSLTIQDGTTATIVTPTGGFINDNDLVNKAYVDSVAAGLDPKESVRVASTADVGGTFAAGSPIGPGDEITGAVGVMDGITLAVDDRVLLKDQTDPTQNGIFVVTVVNAGSPVTVDLVRADDQDGSPTHEVSGGNYTFVEQGTLNATTGWVVQGDGILTLGTDNIDWVQFSESSDYTAGAGLALNGSQFLLDIDNLVAATITTADEIAFNDVTDSNTTRNTTVANFLADLDIVNGITSNGITVRTAEDTYVSRSIVASTSNDRLGIDVVDGDGVAGNPTVGLSIETLNLRAAVDSTDRVPVYDVTTDTNVYYTISDIAGALAATNSFETWAGGGNTSGDANIVADSSTDTATLAGGEGINVDVSNATDTLTLSLDLSTVSGGGSPSVVDVTDEIVINNGGTTVTVTLQEVIDQLGLDIDEQVKVSANDTTPGYLNGKLVAGTHTTLVENNDAGNETLTVDVDLSTINLESLGNVTLTGSPAPADGDLLIYDSVNGWENVPSSSLTFDVCTLTAGSTATLATDDSIAVCDGGSTVRFTFSEIFNTLDVVNGITANGIVVRTADDTYASRSIAVAGVGAGDGLEITNGDGVTGNPTLELDIDGTPVAGENIASNDQFIAYNTSSTANQTFTGQEVADGVADILGLGDLSVQTLGGSGSPGETQLFITDPARSKTLSIAEFTMTYSENNVGNNDWLEIGSASDATSGYVIPYDATLVRATAHVATSSSAKGIDLYIDGTATSPLITLPSGGGAEAEIVDGTLNIDIAAGQKVRLRGASTGGQIGDTVVTLWFRWRA